MVSAMETKVYGTEEGGSNKEEETFSQRTREPLMSRAAGPCAGSPSAKLLKYVQGVVAVVDEVNTIVFGTGR